MSLNWDAFLTDDALNIPNDPWPDIPQVPTATSTEMPKSSSARTSGSADAEDITNFDSLLNGTSADPYFDDSLFGASDYFLSDLEGLQTSADGLTAGDSTEESSPEPFNNGVALLKNKRPAKKVSRTMYMPPNMFFKVSLPAAELYEASAACAGALASEKASKRLTD